MRTLRSRVFRDERMQVSVKTCWIGVFPKHLIRQRARLAYEVRVGVEFGEAESGVIANGVGECAGKFLPGKRLATVPHGLCASNRSF